MVGEPRGSGEEAVPARARALEPSLLAWPFAGVLLAMCPSMILALVIALLLVVPAWRAVRRLGFTPRDEPAGGWWAYGLAMVLAVAMRAYRLDDFPVAINHDEGMNAFVARDLAGRSWQPFSPLFGVGAETAMFYAIAGSLDVFGVRPWVLHLPGVVASIAGLVAMHALAARVFGARVALAALVVAAVSPLPNALGRLSHQTNLVPVVSCLGYSALFWALERGGRRRYFLAGVVLGLGWHVFHGYRANALAAPALALLARWRLRGDETPRGFTAGFPCLLAGYALPFSVVLRQLAVDPLVWLAPLRQHAGGGSWATPGSVLAVLSTALVDGPTGGAPSLAPASLLVLAALPLLARTGDRRGLLLSWLLVTHLAPLAATSSDPTARHRYATVLPALAILAACGWTVLARALRGRWRVAWWVGGFALTLHLAHVTAHQLIQQPNERDPIRRETAVLRAALDRVRDGSTVVYCPSGYHGHAHFALRFFFLDPRIRELPGNDPRAIDRGDDALFVTGAGLGAPTVLDVYPGARQVALELPYPVPAWTETAWLVSREEQHAQRAPLVREGWIHIPRDGRYALAPPSGARGELFVDDRLALRADGSGRWAHAVFARGMARYRLDGDWPAPPRWEHIVPDLEPPPLWSLPEPPTPLPALAASGWGRPGGPGARGGWALTASFTLAHERSRLVDLGSPAFHDVATPGTERLFVALVDRVVAASSDGTIDGEFALDGRVAPIAPAAMASLAVPSRAWSLAAMDARRLVVSAWQRRWVGIVDGRSGAVLAVLERPFGWGEPTDVAVAADGRIAVADRARDRLVVFRSDGSHGGEIGLERPESVCWLGDDLVAIARGRHALVRLVGGRVVAERALGALGAGARIEGVGGAVALVSGPELRFYDAALRLLDVGGDSVVYPPAGPFSAGNITGVAWDAPGRTLWLVSGSSQLVRYRVRP